MVLVQKELQAAYIGEWYVVPTSITLNKSSVSLTTVWQTEQLTATILPADARQTVTWTSSNTSVATVDTTWLVTCVTPWDCTITATTVNWLTATCTVKQNTILDFTTQNVLTFTYRQNSQTWYGWTSWSWYYSAVQSRSYYRTNTTWQMPDSVFGWTLDMIKLELQVQNLYSWWWITLNSSSNTNAAWMWLWAWDTNSTNMMSVRWSYYSYTYPNWINTLVIDFVNGEMYVEGQSSTHINIGTRVTEFRNARNSKALYLNVVANQTYVVTYLRKAEIVTS